MSTAQRSADERAPGPALDDLSLRLLGHGTATVSDALDRLGLFGACLGITPVDPGFQLAGRARTVRYGPVGTVAGTVGDYVDDFEARTVAGLDKPGRPALPVWGDLLTEVAQARGLSGTVIDGACRDTELCARLGYPVFSRARFMRTGKDRVEVSAVERPATLGDVQVRPGDLVLGDPDGVVVVPAAAEDAVLAVAQEIFERESAIVADILAGSTLAAARAKHGYHKLQRENA